MLDFVSFKTLCLPHEHLAHTVFPVLACCDSMMSIKATWNQNKLSQGHVTDTLLACLGLSSTGRNSPWCVKLEGNAQFGHVVGSGDIKH